MTKYDYRLLVRHYKLYIMKGEAISLKSKSQHKLTDEMLHFLFSSSIFQSFSEDEQVAFLQRYKENEAFHDIPRVAMSLNEIIEEVERTMPSIPEEVTGYFKQPRRSISMCLKIEDNVYHYPFGKCIKEQGPLIVCLQQGNRMEGASLFCKGMIIPLFDMCYRQKRDLIILPFSDDVEELRFEYGESPLNAFGRFIAVDKKGDAKIIPTLERIITIVDEVDVKEQTEVFLFTNNYLVDYYDEKVMELVDVLKEYFVSITAISIDEQHPMHFLDKIYYVNE